MPVEVVEKFESRAGDRSAIDLIFVVSGTDDDGEARAALLDATLMGHAGLVRDDASVRVEPTGPNLWEGRVRYVKPGALSADPPKTGDAYFSFDTTGGTQHLTQSLQTINRYAPPGRTAPDFQGAIGVTHDNVEGVDISVPVFNFTVTRYRPAPVMTGMYVATLYGLTGKVNHADWEITVDGTDLLFSAGEVLFLGVSGSKRRGEQDWELNFRFAASPNVHNLTIGNVTGISKKGWEYLWVRYADAEDTAAKAVVKRPIAVYVEKVYATGNFNSLGI